MAHTPFVPIAAVILSLSAGCLSSTTTANQTRPTPAPPPAQAAPAQAAPAQTQSSPVATELLEFVARVEQYHTLRERLTAAGPKLSDKATPEEMDAYKRALAALIIAARTGAKAGDIFVPDMQVVVRKLMASVFSTAAKRANLQATNADENPTGITVAVNTRYPDDVALATMPPEVLKNLPRLPAECEYRFVGQSLILLDTRAHLVVDVMSLAVQKK